jgi:hypothetical protein
MTSVNLLFMKGWARCRENLLANLLAGIVLWIMGGLIIAAFHWYPDFNAVLVEVGVTKAEWGYGYSCLSTAFFGGLVPYCLLFLQGKIPSGGKLAWLAFFLIFWGVKGMEVDAFYRLQGYLFGYSADFLTILSKVLVDQFVYCIFWSAPCTALFYGWKRAGFTLWKDRSWLSLGYILEESAFLLVSTWVIWIPSVSIIYAMPKDLQIPLFNLTLCFFVLVISLLEKPDGKKVAG